MEIQVQKLSPQDGHGFFELIGIFKVVFEMENFELPDERRLTCLLSKPDFLVLVAKCNNRVVGGLTVYILHRYYSARPGAYIYDVAVLTGYQGKGIGTKLIARLIQYCKENDFEEAFVQADADDIQALNFYRKTAVSNELQATHFTYAIG